jgi:hypothetical protein
MEPEPEPEPEPQIKLHQFTEEFQGVRVHGLFALFTGDARPRCDALPSLPVPEPACPPVGASALTAGRCAGTAFVWIGNDSRTMPNLSASSSNKYVRAPASQTSAAGGAQTLRRMPAPLAQSPMPAVSTLMAAAAEQSSVSSERAEAFSQHLGQPTTDRHPCVAACLASPRAHLRSFLALFRKIFSDTFAVSCRYRSAKKLPNVMVLASYQLPAEPAILHEVVSKEVLKRLQPLVDEAAAAAGAAAAASQQQGGGA